MSDNCKVCGKVITSGKITENDTGNTWCSMYCCLGIKVISESNGGNIYRSGDTLYILGTLPICGTEESCLITLNGEHAGAVNTLWSCHEEAVQTCGLQFVAKSLDEMLLKRYKK